MTEDKNAFSANDYSYEREIFLMNNGIIYNAFSFYI